MSDPLWAITGATGYVGRALRTNLAAEGIASRGLGRGGDAEIAGDIRDRVTVENLLRGASVVVHLAACVHRRARGRTAADECWSVNVNGTQTVLDAMRDVASDAFLIFLSSASVYGGDDRVHTESSPIRPQTVYARSKAEAEQRVLSSITSGAIHGCVLRPAMIFGPGAPGNLERLRRVVRTGWVVEIDRGSQRKSVVPISSVIGAIRAVASHAHACNGEILNVAGETLSVHEIINALSGARHTRILSVPKWVMAPALRFVPILETYASSAVISNDKLRRLTNFVTAERAVDALVRLATS